MNLKGRPQATKGLPRCSRYKTDRRRVMEE